MDISATARIGSVPSEAFLAHLRRNAPFHSFIAVYALAGLLLGVLAGVPYKFQPFSYSNALPVAPSLLVAGAGLMALPSSTPLQAWSRNLRVAFGPEALAGILLFASLAIFIGVFTSVKTMLADITPFFADRMLADLDRLLHGQSAWVITNALLPPRLVIVLEWLYYGAWGLAFIGSVLAVLLVPRLRPVRARFIWSFLVTWSLLGNVLAGALMSAGPVYYRLVTGGAEFQELAAYLRHSITHDIAGFLWTSHVNADAVVGAGISAFPSMHLAQATLLVLLARWVHRWLFVAAIAFCAVILFGSVNLGWHYAVDGYFSIAATLIIWKTVGWGADAAAFRAWLIQPIL